MIRSGEPIEAIREGLRRFIVSDLLLGRADMLFDDDTDLFATGLVDSLGLMRLVAHLEETLGIPLGDADLAPEHFGTLARLAAFVSARRPGSP